MDANRKTTASQIESDWASAIADAGNLAQLRVSTARESASPASMATLRIDMPKETVAELERICRSAPFLTWTTLVAGAALYLSCYARTDSVVIAAPSRTDTPGSRPDGIFPALIQVKPGATIREFLQHCRTELSALYTKPSGTVKELHDAGFSAPKSHCPFQIAISYAGLHNSIPEDAADLWINFEQQKGSISANVIFNSSLFTAQIIEDLLAGQFELLRQGLEKADRQIQELSVISPDRAGKLYGTSPLQENVESPEDFVHLFECIAAQQPDAIAIRENDIRVTYGELNRRAGEIARILVSYHMRAEAIVGVAMNRNATAIATILGIWKAGAAYLPCDPNLPAKRLAQILQDSSTKLVLTDRDLNLAADCQADIVRIDRLAGISIPDVPVKSSQSNPQRLAYVIYTSGSTGQPKGVLLSHRGLATMVSAQRQIFNEKECRNVLQFSAHSFDASVFDITMALGHGGTLHVSGDLQIPTGEQLFTVLRDQQITLATIPPCVVATLPAGELPDLQTLVVAGEACSQALADHWSKRLRFVNAYGPTETTIWATFENCTADSPITIGAAIPGSCAYVLDQHLQPLPPGCPGELCISGDNLARGFIGSPAITAQRFVPNPLAGRSGERLYRTGDLVILGLDGRIEFLGRGDNQHKIRGYRIELGDIETALCAHPELEQAVAIVKDGLGDSKTIVAYAVAKGNAPVTSSVLHKFAAERLPEYMVPAQIVMIDEMPLTRSGKVDRAALLKIESASQPADSPTIEEMKSPVEEALAGIWAELLKRKQIALDENFFQLGGHSLLAIQVVSRIRKLFGVNLAARVIFNAPTIRALAQRVEAGRGAPKAEIASVECSEHACSVVGV